MPRPATGDGLGLQRQVVLMRWGGLPVTRPMRGDIDDTSVRCLYGCWAQTSGLLRHAGESLTYFMVVAPIVRSLGRQWPPMEMGDAEGRTLPQLSSEADKAFLPAVGHGPDGSANLS